MGSLGRVDELEMSFAGICSVQGHADLAQVMLVHHQGGFVQRIERCRPGPSGEAKGSNLTRTAL